MKMVKITHKIGSFAGLAQIPILIGLVIMAVAIPIATNLVQRVQENRSKAVEVGCENINSGNSYKNVPEQYKETACNNQKNCEWKNGTCVEKVEIAKADTCTGPATTDCFNLDIDGNRLSTGARVTSCDQFEKSKDNNLSGNKYVYIPGTGGCADSNHLCCTKKEKTTEKTSKVSCYVFENNVCAQKELDVAKCDEKNNFVKGYDCRSKHTDVYNNKGCTESPNRGTCVKTLVKEDSLCDNDKGAIKDYLCKAPDSYDDYKCCVPKAVPAVVDASKCYCSGGCTSPTACTWITPTTYNGAGLLNQGYEGCSTYTTSEKCYAAAVKVAACTSPNICFITPLKTGTKAVPTECIQYNVDYPGFTYTEGNIKACTTAGGNKGICCKKETKKDILPGVTKEDGKCGSVESLDSAPTDKTADICLKGQLDTTSVKVNVDEKYNGMGPSGWTWYCAGWSGGARSVKCFALKKCDTGYHASGVICVKDEVPVTKVDGECSATTVYISLDSVKSEDLCTKGQAAGLLENNKLYYEGKDNLVGWTWYCKGLNGGKNSGECLALKKSTDIPCVLTCPSGWVHKTEESKCLPDTVADANQTCEGSNCPAGYNKCGSISPYTCVKCVAKADTGVICPEGTKMAGQAKKLGDANCDGHVTEVDYNIWLQELKGIKTTKTADFDGDGVDIKDFTTWNTNLEK